jgi:heptosyltransferase-2
MLRELRVSTLVIQTAFLGDVVLTTPLLTRLAERHGPLDVLVTPAAATLLEGHPAVRAVLPYDKRGNDRGLRGILRMGATLRARGYERVYLPHRSVRSAALALLSRAPARIGFSDSPAAWTYTSRIPRAGAHEIERLAGLAGPGPVPEPSLGLTASDRRAAAEWLGHHGVGGDFIALAPGSVWATKRWPGYADLAAALPGPVIVIGGPEDSETGRAIAAQAPARIHSAAGALPLRASAALIERAGVLVTNDSAPLHLAGAVGTPVVAIFGPTVPAFGFGPRGASDRVVEVSGLSCRPCSAHGPMRCPLGHHRCMVDIAAATVVAAVEASRGRSKVVEGVENVEDAGVPGDPQSTSSTSLDVLDVLDRPKSDP